MLWQEENGKVQLLQFSSPQQLAWEQGTRPVL